MKRWGLLLIIGGVVVVLVGIFALGNKAPASNQNAIGQHFAEQERKHIDEGTKSPVEYNSNPPSSGPHYPQPAPWGVKDTAEADERYIHNLEHGGVWITYKPDLAADQLNQLKAAVSALPPDAQFNEVKIVMSPRAANTSPVSLVAWTYVENLDTPDATKIKDFYLNHVDKGPELIP